MKKIGLILLFTVVYLSSLHTKSYLSVNESNRVCEESSSEFVDILFAGDVMGHMPQVRVAYNKERNEYDFRPCFQYLKPYIESADLAVANLEVSLAGEPYSGYPNFSSPDALFDGLVWAGFDVVLLANNHVADKGRRGITKTIQTIEKQAQYAGVYADAAARDSLYPLIINIKGVQIALLNCTYGTNFNPVYLPQMVNLIDTVQIKQDVLKAQKQYADLLIMNIHWGDEYKVNANDYQAKLARFFARIGIDLVVGSHPHVVQNFEYINTNDSTKMPVYYSLGNFVSNQRKRNTNGGIMAKVTVNVNTRSIVTCGYLPFYVHKGEIEEKFQYYLLPTVDYLSKKLKITLPAKEDSLLMLFDTDTKKRLHNLPIVR